MERVLGDKGETEKETELRGIVEERKTKRLKVLGGSKWDA